MKRHYFDDRDYYLEEEEFRRAAAMLGHGDHRNPVDKEGKPVERTRAEFPYSYDEYVEWRGGPNSAIDHAVYSDRLRQWDPAKYERLVDKHNPGAGAGGRWDPGRLQAFLREYQDDPGLRLVLIMNGCDRSTGHTIWSFHYASGKSDASASDDAPATNDTKDTP